MVVLLGYLLIIYFRKKI